MKTPNLFRRALTTQVPLDSLRPELIDMIRASHPDLGSAATVPLALVRATHEQYLEALLRNDLGELSDLDAEVAHAIAHRQPVAAVVDDDFAETRGFGDRAADLLASFGGSWSFIILFSIIIAGWMTLSQMMGKASFDPYPYILLNLMLSTLAAVQAPIIMMSQNRQEEKDRLRARNDYQVNLKAELEIRALHDRLEWLIARVMQDVEKAEASLASGRHGSHEQGQDS